jgi:hypothetical protein
MKLTLKQKQILIQAYQEGERNYNLSYVVIEALEKVKYTETLPTDASRFIGDYDSQIKYGRKTEKELKEWVKGA